MKTLLTGGLVGAILVYFLDPAHGSQRRGSLMQKAGSSTGPLSKATAPLSKATAPLSKAKAPLSKATGMMKGRGSHQPDNPHPDDQTLRDRVESEIFRDTETSRENININVVNGVVTVRGELPNQGEIDALVKRIQGIANVRGVESFLHLPGTPAPNKVESIRASS